MRASVTSETMSAAEIGSSFTVHSRARTTSGVTPADSIARCAAHAAGESSHARSAWRVVSMHRIGFPRAPGQPTRDAGDPGFESDLRAHFVVDETRQQQPMRRG